MISKPIEKMTWQPPNHHLEKKLEKMTYGQPNRFLKNRWRKQLGSYHIIIS
jgi:hypothetical protein